MSDDTLKITIVGKSENVDGQSFVGTLTDFLQLLAELDRSISGEDGGSVEWVVSNATANSPVTIELQGRPKVAANYAPILAKACLDGLESMEAGRPLPAKYDLISESRLRRMLSHVRNGIDHLSFAKNGRKIDTTPQMIANAERLVALEDAQVAVRANHREYGEVEGRVETVSSHLEYYFTLWELLSGKAVKCKFKEHLREKVRAAWEKRAVVLGVILFGPDGMPRSIDVDDLEIKPDSKQPPQFKDFGIDITDGVESSLYIRGLRDAD